MESVMKYDLIFLAIFCAGIFWFLYSHKKNLKREGWMYMYRTKLGLDAINKFSKKYSKLLHALKYPIVVLGFILMSSIIFLLCQTVYTYIRYPQISEIIKAPPIMPLIPYFPQIFHVESLMPPFYFTYFILALLIVAVVHEFSHGVYMRLFKTKIKSTGFAFLGPILGAFVEQDDKDFQKKKNFEQMVVLGAGVFANILFAVIFFVLLVLFFSISYSPAGYIFTGYAYNLIEPSQIQNYSELSNGWVEISTDNANYVYTRNVSSFSEAIKSNPEFILAYYDAPAIKNNLSGAITEIDGIKIKGSEDVSFYLEDKKPGEIIIVKTINNKKEINVFSLNLSKHPVDNTRGFLGVTHSVQRSNNFLSGIVLKIIRFKDSSVYYSAKYNSNVAEYFYNLLWWVAMINLFVGLFNMLPIGILDGGRFFYLSILSITKNEKTAKKYFKYAIRFIGLIFVAMILSWIFSLF